MCWFKSRVMAVASGAKIVLSSESVLDSWRLGAVSIKRCCLTSIGIPMLKIRLSHDCVIFNMGIPTPGKDGLYIETGPRSSYYSGNGGLWPLPLQSSCSSCHLRSFGADLAMWSLSVVEFGMGCCSCDHIFPHPGQTIKQLFIHSFIWTIYLTCTL